MKTKAARKPWLLAPQLFIFASIMFFPQLMAQAGADEGSPAAFLPNPVRAVSTVPANGDVNPYGVAFVPPRFPAGGTLHPGDVLVTNFNNSQNQQGTGSTIMQVPAGAAPAVFFQATSGIGPTTALAVLKEGLVVFGSMPTADGTCGTAQAGSLVVLDSSGNQLSSIAEADIDGPWDMTVFERGGGRAQLFVANALSGTITRLDATVNASGLTVVNHTQIASGYLHRCDPVALVVAPTGLVYDPAKDVLYVASTEDNAVFAVPEAGRTTKDEGTGRVIYRDNHHLHGPLGMAEAPNGHLLVANSDVINSDPNQASEIVEFTVDGKFVKQLSMDPQQGGSFGLAVASSRGAARFAAVDDVTNLLLIWTLPQP